jgi:hypothetical protein
MEATCSPETSDDFQQTTRRYIPEDSTFHNHRCENLKSYVRTCLQKTDIDQTESPNILTMEFHSYPQFLKANAEIVP